jgi:hypothetical protein
VKKPLIYFIIAFWCVMAALFVRREIIPGLYPGAGRGYGSVRAYARTHAGYTMGVWTPTGSRVGEIKVSYQLKDNGDCEVASKAHIRFTQHSLMALALPSSSAGKNALEMFSNLTFGADDRLKSFRIACDTPLGAAFAYGEMQGEALKITINVAGEQIVRVIPLKGRSMLSSSFMAIGALPGLNVGQEWQVRTLDPLKLFEKNSFPFHTTTARVTGRTRILLRGAWYDVYRVELDRGTVKAVAWVNEDGDVLKEEAFNLVLVLEPLPHEEGEAAGDETRDGIPPKP